MEEWISLNAFMEKFHIGYPVALQMLHDGKFEYKVTDGGRYKIRVGGDTVPRAMYEEAVERAIKAETKLESMQAILAQ